MKTRTTLITLFTSLTNNTSSANQSLASQLLSDQHRYLLQKYFDNERSVTTTTVGAASLTLTGSLAIGATSATLTASWTYPTAYQLVNFSSGQQRNVLFANGSAAISWAGALTSTATTAITTVGVQYYNIPADVSKIKDGTISVGQLKYRPKEVKTIQEWNDLNVLPYTSDIPQCYFIYNGQMGIFPIPSTTGNVIGFNYKCRVADLSYSDYSTGTLAAAGMAAGSTTVTGLATSWSATGLFPLTADLTYQNLCIRADPPYGDGIWYPIRSFASDTSLTLALPVVNAPNITAATTYTIGQIPILSEDFHDMIVYGALRVYFSSIAKDPDQYKEFDALYKEKMAMLGDYAGVKALNVDLGDDPLPQNPNLYLYANS